MNYKKTNKLECFTFSSFDKYGLFNICTKKDMRYFDGFDLSIVPKIDDQNVKSNINILCKECNIDINKVKAVSQYHTNNIVNVTSKDMYTTDLVADGLITDIQDLYLSVYCADCTPVMYYDIKNKVVGILHSGWKGTMRGINSTMLNMFKEKYNSNMSDIIVGIGPHAQRCCYEVKHDFIYTMKNETDINKYLVYNNKKIFFNHKKMIIDILLNHGIKNDNIEVSDKCTMCEKHEFFSYRLSGKGIGNQLNIIGMGKDNNEKLKH